MRVLGCAHHDRIKVGGMFIKLAKVTIETCLGMIRRGLAK
jgi:hypothetical protein